MVIRVLSTQLANQIAAGEVVERPASVIKELVENSIDAGASRIDIDVEQGGSKRISVCDNGCGISKDELPLALARHATSKIAHFDDLAAITSLGFRGEALASVSAVSRLTLTSRTALQSEAWQVYTEGRDMLATLKPAAHPIGSTVEVLNLFYNTPARRRFLKANKTEFMHIDETIKKIALVCPQVTVNFQHNGKLIGQYRAGQDQADLLHRITAVCGQSFMAQAIKLEWQHDDLNILGWVNTNVQHGCQYLYVNQRIVKDRILSHAIKQAYNKQNNEDNIAYVIFLSVDPHQVDVNVHPTKHEVRFHESRLVHDFVYQAILMAINTIHAPSPLQAKEPQTAHRELNRQAAGSNIFTAECHQVTIAHKKMYEPTPVSQRKIAQENMLNQELLLNNNNFSVDNVAQKVSNSTVLPDNKSKINESDDIDSVLFPKRTAPFVLNSSSRSLPTFGKVIAVLLDSYAVLQRNDALQLLSLENARHVLCAVRLCQQTRKPAEKLLISLTLQITDAEKLAWQMHKALLYSFNLHFEITTEKIRLSAIPSLLRDMSWQKLIPSLSAYLLKCNDENKALCHEILADWFAKKYIQFDKLNKPRTSWAQTQVITLLTELEQSKFSDRQLSMLLQDIDLSQPLALLQLE